MIKKIKKFNNLNSKFKVGDYVIADYKDENNPIGIYIIHNIIDKDFFYLINPIDKYVITGYFIKLDLRLATDDEIEKIELFKNMKKYNL